MKTSLYTTDSFGNKIYIAILDDYSSVTFNYSTLIANKQYSPLYETTFDLMSDADIKTQIDLWINNKTLPNANLLATSFDKRVRSVGKNLFDKSMASLNMIRNENTGVATVFSGNFLSNQIKVKPSTTYRITGGVPNRRVCFFDIDKVFISGLIENVIFTTPSNAYYLDISTNMSVIDDVMLELGTVSTTYEPYVHNDLYIQGNSLGYRLPNGVKDEELQRDGKMYRVKRINTVAVVGVVAVNTTNYPLAKNGGQFINYLTAGGSEIGVIGTNSTSGDGFMLYELSTPVETEILAFGNLQGQPNGTVYVENATQDADIYATSATISNTALPISSLSEVIKIGADGLQTRLAVATAVVAGDGLSFTHSGLTAGDMVWFSYYHLGNYLSSTTTITYYDNNNVLISPDGSAWKETRTIDNSGAVTSLWVKV